MAKYGLATVDLKYRYLDTNQSDFAIECNVKFHVFCLDSLFLFDYTNKALSWECPLFPREYLVHAEASGISIRLKELS